MLKMNLTGLPNPEDTGSLLCEKLILPGLWSKWTWSKKWLSLVTGWHWNSGLSVFEEYRDTISIYDYVLDGCVGDMISFPYHCKTPLCVI